MSADEHLSPSQFTFTHHESPSTHTVVAHHPEGPRERWGEYWLAREGKSGSVGHIEIDKGGTIDQVEVHPDYRRRGLAAEMQRRVHAASGLKYLNHSSDLTVDGKKYAEAMKRR